MEPRPLSPIGLLPRARGGIGGRVLPRGGRGAAYPLRHVAAAGRDLDHRGVDGGRGADPALLRRSLLRPTARASSGTPRLGTRRRRGRGGHAGDLLVHRRAAGGRALELGGSVHQSFRDPALHPTSAAPAPGHREPTPRSAQPGQRPQPLRGRRRPDPARSDDRHAPHPAPPRRTERRGTRLRQRGLRGRQRGHRFRRGPGRSRHRRSPGGRSPRGDRGGAARARRVLRCAQRRGGPRAGRVAAPPWWWASPR